MKKILKEPYVLFKATCPHCGCIFEYDIGEICVSSSVVCPCCYRTVAHDAEDNGVERRKDDE